MRTTASSVLLLLSFALAAEGQACIYSAPAVRLPNEPDAAYQARDRAFRQAQEDEGRRRMQVSLFDGSEHIALGVVRTTKPVPFAEAGGALGAEIVAEVLVPMKGSGLQTTLQLADNEVTSCGIGGAGNATRARPGEYVIVFFEPRPFGILVGEVREPRLVEALSNASARLRDEAEGAKSSDEHP